MEIDVYFVWKVVCVIGKLVIKIELVVWRCINFLLEFVVMKVIYIV